MAVERRGPLAGIEDNGARGRPGWLARAWRAVRGPGDRLIWGVLPIISNKYWSAAMRRAGWKSQTLVTGNPYMYSRDDFDLWYSDFVPAWLRSRAVARLLGVLLATLHVLRTARVLHIPFSGGPLGSTPLWRLEAPLLRLFGVRTVLIPYGADVWMYSRVPDASVRHGLLRNYPRAAREEPRIRQRVEYWGRRADAIIGAGFLSICNLHRWDVLTLSPLCIDTDEWTPKADYSDCDGRNGVVRILHTPNHRLYKGTEFFEAAVSRLRQEGLEVELVLLEKAPNADVRRTMHSVDLLAEQCITTGHGLSAIEGMAAGLPVLANLERSETLRAFRRYGFLDECPIVSTAPETALQTIRALVTHPELRRELGIASRQYVEKHHSYEAMARLFGSVYRRILGGEDVDLASLFHPLRGDSESSPLVRHPLVENRLPREYLHVEGRPPEPEGSWWLQPPETPIGRAAA